MKALGLIREDFESRTRLEELGNRIYQGIGDLY